MSSSESISSESSGDDVYDLEIDDETSQSSKQENTMTFTSPYECEPLASEDWLANYNREQEEEEEKLNNLRLRLNGTTAINEWLVMMH